MIMITSKIKKIVASGLLITACISVGGCGLGAKGKVKPLIWQSKCAKFQIPSNMSPITWMKKETWLGLISRIRIRWGWRFQEEFILHLKIIRSE